MIGTISSYTHAQQGHFYNTLLHLPYNNKFALDFQEPNSIKHSLLKTGEKEVAIRLKEMYNAIYHHF